MKNIQNISSFSQFVPSTLLPGSLAALMAHSASGFIQVGSGPLELDNNGEIWTLDGPSGTLPVGDFYSFSGNYIVSFVETALNNFRFADQGFQTVRALTSGASITNNLFTAAFSGGFVKAFSYSAFGNDWANFTIGQASFAGFRFDVGLGVQYGWVNLTWQADGDVILNEWAWAGPGESISVGQIPEPAGLGALAAGAAGLAAWRRRRAA